MSAITYLKHLALAHYSIKHPNIPLHALVIPKYTDKTANGLTKCIIDFLRFSGHQAERVNTTGIFQMRKTKHTDVIGRTRTIKEGFFRPSGVTKGSADIHATIEGRSVKIEVKIGQDRQSPHQQAYQHSIEQAGGIYLIATTFDHFLSQYHTLFSQ